MDQGLNADVTPFSDVDFMSTLNSHFQPMINTVKRCDAAKKNLTLAQKNVDELPPPIAADQLKDPKTLLGNSLRLGTMAWLSGLVLGDDLEPARKALMAALKEASEGRAAHVFAVNMGLDHQDIHWMAADGPVVEKPSEAILASLKEYEEALRVVKDEEERRRIRDTMLKRLEEAKRAYADAIATFRRIYHEASREDRALYDLAFPVNRRLSMDG